MSLRKTSPPPTSQQPSQNLKVGAVHNRTHSDPNLSISADIEEALINVTQRNFNTKRKRQEQGENDLEDFKSLMMNMFHELKATMNEIKEQNKQLQESVNFTAAKYDEVMEMVKKNNEDRSEDRKYIRQLEEKLEQFERQNRATSIEIRNIPKTLNETKQGLSKMVIEIGKIINVPIHENDVKDVFRVTAKSNKPLIVDFTTVLQKERMLNAAKKFNRDNTGRKLSTEHLNLNGLIVPIFIFENLTAKSKRLFFLSREFSSQNNFKYCWTSYGKVYLRKEDGAPPIRIESELDISKLKNKL